MTSPLLVILAVPDIKPKRRCAAADRGVVTARGNAPGIGTQSIRRVEYS